LHKSTQKLATGIKFQVQTENVSLDPRLPTEITPVTADVPM